MNSKYKYFLGLILFNLTFIFLLLSITNDHDDQSRIFIRSERISTLSTLRLSTPGCNISDLPLFDQETSRIFENKSERIWDCKSGSNIKINRFNETWIKITSTKDTVLCFYRSLSRGKDDFDYVYGKFQGPIKNNQVNLDDIEIAHVACYKDTIDSTQILANDFDKSDSNLLYHQIIPLIPDKGKTTKANIPNILLMFIDSTSYLHFQRHFTRARTLMDKYGFHELRGYNKVGANTFPNMLAWFTGLLEGEVVQNEEFDKIIFDDLPFIWRNYSNLGFNFLMMEEMCEFGIYTYEGLMKGFKKRIIDYETRPFQLELRNKEYHYNRFCYAEKTEMELSLDYTFDFIKAMKKRNQKYFAYISVSEMNHNWANGIHYMDEPYSNFFESIFENKLNEDTLIVFFSDHGMRFGPLKETHTGEMEDRLPFIFIYVPDTLKNFPINNLIINQDRLTTPLDMHATLLHIMQGKKYKGFKRGVSLFEKIKDTRTCESADIDEIFCACHDDVLVGDHETIRPMQTVPKIMTKLNSLTDRHRDVCSTFEFVSIKNIYKRRVSKGGKGYQLGDSDVYIVQFYVNPGNALFEVLVRSFFKNTRFEVIGQFVRVNRYNDQSHCVRDKILKNFCFCLDKLEQYMN